MPSIVLRKHSQPQQLSNKDILNTQTPLSYREWITNNVGIIPDSAERQYQQYLDEWYGNKETNISLTAASTKIKEDYVSLLKRLSVIFQNDEDFNRIAHIDFDSDSDLTLAIPYFARKLKEIALYYINKRESLKTTKLKYNMVGADNALERILYEYILQAFTKKKNSLTISSKEIYNNVPDLSAVNKDFVIEIEDLYDMTNYFDRDNNTTGNYDLSSTNPLLFVLDDYIANIYNAFDLGDVPLSGLVNPLSEFVLCETDRDINLQTLANLGGKYIGNDVYFLTGGYYDFQKRLVDFDFEVGNNFFYWFSGEYIRELPDGTFQDLPLSALDWTNATGGSAFDTSDIIFVWAGNRLLEGAWLMKNEILLVNDTMSATMTNGKQFKFPYPGIGTSAEGGDWSGKLIIDTKEDDKRFFPSESAFLNTQEIIKDLYWSAVSSISSVIEINIQDTSLYQSGAFAATQFKNADKITIRRDVGEDSLHDTLKNQFFNGKLETAWLFDFKQTEIPIKIGSNNIYYPLTSFETSDELFFRYESGHPVALSALPIGSSFAGAIAGNTLEDADLLIKLNSVCGPELEAAWLKGTPLSSYSQGDVDLCTCEPGYKKYFTGWKFDKGVTQPSLSFKLNPSKFHRFVWTGTRTRLNDIKAFGGFEHDDSCEYKKSQIFPSILDTNFLKSKNKDIYEKWKTCTCKTVHYSPMGHNGNDFLSYRYPTDFIVKDTSFPNDFSFNNWRGSDGLDYRATADLAWFRINNLLEKDVGWGAGSWTTNDANEFYLEPGKTYIYYRSDLNRCGFELPYYILNHGYCDCEINSCEEIACTPHWRKAVMNDAGQWTDAGEISDMVLNSGNFLTYNHKEAQAFSKSIFTYDDNIILETSGTMVLLLSSDPKISHKEVTFNQDALNFLVKVPLSGNNPYWGEASFDDMYSTQNKLKMWGTPDFNIYNEYLQVRQPVPSQTILQNNDTIEYHASECNSCFIWAEPLTFAVQTDILRWNKILVDECVNSEILNYLHERTCNPCIVSEDTCYSECQATQICGCTNLCYPVKTGVTATKIPSDIILNTELSGIPLFVDYYARNSFNMSVEIIETTNGVPPYGGVWVPPVSSIFAKAQMPWMNIINDFYPTVAADNNGDLYNQKTLGLFLPERLGTGRYELKDGKYALSYLERNADSFDLVRNNGYADGDIDVVSTNSSWMKFNQGQSFAGNVKRNKHQTYYPYTTNEDMFNFNHWGLGSIKDQYSPYDENGEWSDDSHPPNFRNLHATCGDNSWYNNQIALSGRVMEWQTDIYGNQYFLINSADSTKLLPKLGFNRFLIKKPDGTILNTDDVAEELFHKYRNINF